MEAARDLKRAAEDGSPPQALSGCHIALLGEGDDQAASDAFINAAGGLGARVTRIRLSELRTSQAQVDQKTARLLGHLYDGIVCVGCTADLIAWLERHADIPVCDQPQSTNGGARSTVDCRYLLLAQLVNKLS